MKKVKVAHISDLHLSDGLFSDDGGAIKGTAGHSLDRFKVLTEALNNIEWDLLLITGDISKNGSKASFSTAKTWLEDNIYINKDTKIGLNLGSSKREYIIVPGNHDYYNNSIFQSYNDTYLEFFDYVGVNEIIEKEINNIKVNVHLYDSTKKRSVAKGKLRDGHKTQRFLIEDELDIAMLHHHIVTPPHLNLSRNLELEDIRKDTNYLLSCGFNSILFGHTHRYFQSFISDRVIIKNFSVRRGKKRQLRNLIKGKLFKKFKSDDSNCVSYKREKSRRGQYPDFNSYMEYLYIINIIGDEIKGPSEFISIKSFYSHLEEYKDKNGQILLEKIFERNLHISMAESACQKYEKSCGFNIMEYDFSDRKLTCSRVIISNDGYCKRGERVTDF